MSRVVLLILTALFFSCKGREYKDPHVLIVTNLGDIEVELYPSKAPKTVAAFLHNIETGLYNNSSFYRVLKTEDMPTDFNTGIIQGGIWKTNAAKAKELTGIPHESTRQSGFSHTDGTLSMARTDTGTAKTEFFICIDDQSPLDAGRRGTADGQGYAAFGKVTRGMSTVRKIQAQKSHGDQFNVEIKITRIEKL